MSDIEIKIISFTEFKKISEEIHQIVFQEYRPRELERIDFAILFFYQKTLGGYMTFYEHNSEQIYIQFGGALPKFRNSPLIYKAYDQAIKQLLSQYSYLLTFVENNNIAMLKLALKTGWKIIGTRMTTDGRLLVELINYNS
ncbi:hypothetical protein H6G96_33620 [Nostoc sp. FACHB-892]|uniref:hypothetical protein n=1 Tax=Nostoc sp. FACHB-892 TaxID=2692843 RepID=UPI0016839176|nr:hypothetical protein [Nostoc sp. FACHB-892]MBD2731124.1 hypothetical protein [Nostoc sp. FACHB-892]